MLRRDDSDSLDDFFFAKPLPIERATTSEGRPTTPTKSVNPPTSIPRTPVRESSASKPGSSSLNLASPHHSSTGKRKIATYDRYIPDRSDVDYGTAFLLGSGADNPLGSPSKSSKKSVKKVENDAIQEEAHRLYSRVLKSEMFGSTYTSMDMAQLPSANLLDSKIVTPPRKMLQYKSSTEKLKCARRLFVNETPSSQKYSLTPLHADSKSLLQSPRKPPRNISKIPFKILDAPDLADDFYLNLVEWGPSNILAVGLNTTVYLWSACTSRVTKLCDIGPYDSVTSGNHLAIGTNRGIVQIWDVTKSKKLRDLGGHSGRIGALSWNDHILTSGGRDRLICHRDVRCQEPFIKKLTGHKQEVCGLKWNADGTHLASGGNDNRLLIWDRNGDSPLYKFTEHAAAVKALAWSPHQRGLLVSGGGTADRKIRFWNTTTGTPLQHVDTGSQICNLAWSKTSNELVSTHGYSQNQIVIWKYPTMQQLAVLTGHTYRVLYLSMSPDGQTIVTGAGDETLRFWNVFNKGSERSNADSLLSERALSIR